jgi:predicted nucleic acid-binding protein
VNLFFDTNVLIAMSDTAHQHHERSDKVFVRPSHTRFCAAHSLAEFYAITTRLPRNRTPPEACDVLIEGLLEQMTAIALTAAEYRATIRCVAEAGLTGGMVYDALLLACARKCKADVIYTFNERHFARIAPDLAERIQAP